VVKMIELTDSDGHKLLRLPRPSPGQPRGGLSWCRRYSCSLHIRTVADGFAPTASSPSRRFLRPRRAGPGPSATPTGHREGAAPSSEDQWYTFI